MIYFDFKNLGFLDSRIHKIPEWAVQVTEAKRAHILAGEAGGKRISADAGGNPVLVEIPPLVEAQSVLLERAKNELRAMREPMLSAVTGIGWEASEAGDDALVQEARNIRNALRDITDDPALNAAQTYEEMRAAGVAAYRRIAGGVSPAFAATFKEFTGA